LDRFSADSGLRIWYSNGQKAKRRILGLVCKEMCLMGRGLAI